MHRIRYLRFYYYHWWVISLRWFTLLSMFRHWHGISEGIIHPVVNVSSLTWFIRRYHSPCCQCFVTDMGLSEGIIRPVVNVSSLTWFIRRYHSPCCQCFSTDMVYPKVSFTLLSMFRHWHGVSEGIIRPVVNVSALTWFIRRYNSPCCQCFVTDMVYPKV